MNRNIVIYTSGAVILGCAVAYLWDVWFYLPLVLAVLAAFIAWGLRRKSLALTTALCIAFFALGLFRVAHSDVLNTDIVFESKETHAVRGIVVSDIEDRGGHSRYEVLVESIDGETPRTGKILVYEEYPTRCVIGERIRFEGALQQPENFITSTGREFDYVHYLRQQGVYGTSFIRESGCVGYADKEHISFFASVREKLVDGIRTALPQKEGALLGGLLLGLRGDFSEETLEYFRISGLLHIVVLSGYNVTLVAEAVRRLTLWLSPLSAMVIALIVVAGFVLLSGTQTAALRAGGMGSIALIARATYREYDGLRALFLVGALMTLYNPAQLIHSASFHMSFLATLGLLLFAPALERRIGFITDRFQLRSIIAVTAATQLFLVPYLAYAIGEVSLIGFLANVLVLPLIPLAMLFGAVVIGIALVSPLVASILAPLAYIPLRIILSVTEHLASVPYAAATLPQISGWITILTYAGLAYVGCKYIWRT